jgi:hypothetical protein
MAENEKVVTKSGSVMTQPVKNEAISTANCHGELVEPGCFSQS